MIVSSVEEKPYTHKKSSRTGTGDIEYEGFCIDLLNKLSERLGFEYKIQIVSDGKYGEQLNGTDQWDGMIGELLNGV